LALEPLSLFNAATLFVTFAYACYQDLRWRIVDDWVWLLGGAITSPATIYTVILGLIDPVLAASSAMITSVLALLLYKLGMYGGADAKGLVVIGLAYPLSREGLRFHPFTPISTLLNGLLISLSIPLSLAVINTYRILVRREDLFRDFRDERAYRKLLAMFIGTVIESPERHRYWASMEEPGESWRFRFSPNIEEYWRPVRRGGWATPSIPLLIPLFIGLIINHTVGDLSALLLALLTP